MVFTVFTKSAFACLFIWTFISCKSNADTDGKILSDIEEGLMRTNATLHVQSSNVIEALKEKAADPKTAVKAEIWLPKAEKVQQLSIELNEYINGLKTMLRKEAGIDETNKGNNTNTPVNTVFIDNKKADELYSKLQDFRKSILSAADERQRNDLNKFIVILNKELDTIRHATENFKQDYFSSSNTYEVLTYLSNLQNNVLTAANKCITYFHENILYHGPQYDSYEAIVAQNAKILKAGAELEIMAGLGAFSRQHLPKITINDQPIKVDERGIAVYKIKTSKKAGNYSLPVSIEFLDRDGQQITRTFNVEYALVEELKRH